MQINLSPTRGGMPLTLHRRGDVLTVNGEAFDFSALEDGASLPAEAISGDWFAGPVERTGGRLVVTLVLPHGAGAPDAVRFPAPILDPADGPVPLPTDTETRT